MRSGRGTRWTRAGTGPSVVLLHGGAGSASHWIRNIPHLAATHTVWAPDLPGMGDSADAPAPRDHDAIAGVLAADIAELMPAGERFDIAGFSFGAIVGGVLAGSLPGRVRSLVLVGAGGLGLRDQDERILKPWKTLADPARRESAHRYNLAALMLCPRTPIDDATLALYVADVTRTRVNSARYSRTTALRDRIATLGIPVHGIWGREDVTCHGRFDDIRAMLAAAHPGAQLHVIADAGHWVQYEQAEACNRALDAVLSAA